MNIVKNRKVFYAISGVLTVASLASVAIFGLRLGIDFKGGSLLEVSYVTNVPTVEEVREEIEGLGLQASVRETGDNGYIVRAREMDQDEKAELLSKLSFGGTKEPTEVRFNSIGPLLGKEAAIKSFVSIGLVILCIILFIAFAFRKVSEPVSSWKYGLIAIVALLHDVIIPVGAAALLGHYAGFEVDTLFVTALLVILGFSVHDTIVVFDRVREHLRHNKEYREKKEFETIVEESIQETFARSINTSLTTLLALLALYFVGAEATKNFALMLIIGIIAGTYSSIFLGSPLLVTVEKMQAKQR